MGHLARKDIKEHAWEAKVVCHSRPAVLRETLLSHQTEPDSSLAGGGADGVTERPD